MTFDAAMQSILRYVEQAPAPVGWAFDPAALVRAVNGLQPLGTARALEILREYVRRAEQVRAPDTDTRPVLLILRLLFVPAAPATSLPPFALGNPDIPLPNEDPAWPYLPLALSHDLPFLLVGDYMVGGGMRSPRHAIDEYATKGRLRAERLNPREPAEAVELLLNSQEWQRIIPAERRLRSTAMLYTQVLRAVQPVYPTDEADYQTLAAATPPVLAKLWEGHKAAIQSLKLRWDAQQQAFALAA